MPKADEFVIIWGFLILEVYSAYRKEEAFLRNIRQNSKQRALEFIYSIGSYFPPDMALTWKKEEMCPLNVPLRLGQNLTINNFVINMKFTRVTFDFHTWIMFFSWFSLNI